MPIFFCIWVQNGSVKFEGRNDANSVLNSAHLTWSHSEVPCLESEL